MGLILGITDKVLAITPPETIGVWKAEDPLCSRHAWYNMLMYFAASSAEKFGLIKAIRKPEWMVCRIVGIQFDDLCATLISGKDRGLKDTFMKYKMVEKKFRKSLDGRVEGHDIIKFT